ncbi:MAG: hypothetical protein IPM13_09260 [Phycisphaerales bacterium]|nr:hypothetical protein [Phycisphaerales bacterium]
MRFSRLKASLLALVSGGVCLQVVSCFDVVTAVSSALTAGGVLYLVRRVID